MKHFFSKIVCIAVAVLLGLQVTACSDLLAENELIYPDYGYANADSDSWKQIDASDLEETVKVTWYIDTSTLTGSAELVELMKDKFNIEITYRNPITDDGSELSTMISVGNLPDIITISDYTTRIQLAEEKYVYPLQTLAEKYAPTLLDRIPQEMVDYYCDENGLIYGYPANFYRDDDLQELKELGGSVMGNYAIVVREDWLNEYLKAFPQKADSAMKPDEFIEMCTWVKNKYGLQADNPTVCLEQFTMDSTTEGTRAITALSEFFAVPKEDEDGNLVYQWDEPLQKEMMLFLNKLYRNKLISSGNLSANKSIVASYIQQGMPFAVIGATQNFQSNFRILAINKDINYVPIVITNAAGDMPVLTSVAGRGNRVTMITGNCNRVDRIIKMFDYLISEEGHRDTYYGTEGDTYTVEVEPMGQKTVTVNGEEKTHVYRYGQYKWTDKAWNAYQHYNYTPLKIHTYFYMQNPLYAALTDSTGFNQGFILMANFMNWNHKAVYAPVVYNKIPFNYNLDYSDERYNDMVDLQVQLQQHWLQYLSKIIIAPSAEEAGALYDKALTTAHNMGSAEYTAFCNISFQALKDSMGIEYAWMPNDPDSSYHDVRLGLLGATEYLVEIPDNVNTETFS